MTKHIFRQLFFSLLVLAFAAWGIVAFSVQFDGIVQTVASIALGATAIFAVVSRWLGQTKRAWLVAGTMAVAVLGWYATIIPQDNRTWAQDVSRGVKAEVAGTQVFLSDVRDFAWQTRSEAEARWITAQYDLDRLETVDMALSTWGNPDIAHLLVSFGFANQDNVVFSVEIRREEHEVFNEVGGFFRQFEIVLIAATERDILKLRTNHRDEQVSLYPLDLDAAQRRNLFMAYVSMAQRLEDAPEFYNTITANCTTSVYQLVRSIRSDVPFHEALILSGRLPDFLEELGYLGGEGSLEDRKAAALITPRAQALPEGANYSAWVRES